MASLKRSVNNMASLKRSIRELLENIQPLYGHDISQAEKLEAQERLRSCIRDLSTTSQQTIDLDLDLL